MVGRLRNLEPSYGVNNGESLKERGTTKLINKSVFFHLPKAGIWCLIYVRCITRGENYNNGCDTVLTWAVTTQSGKQTQKQLEHNVTCVHSWVVENTKKHKWEDVNQEWRAQEDFTKERLLRPWRRKPWAHQAEKGIVITHRKACRKYMTCWEDPVSTKLKGSKFILFKYREKIKSLSTQCC